MYRGVNVQAKIRSYETAVEALEHRSRYKITSHGDFSLGHPRRDVIGISSRGSGAIVLRLYETDVVIWHPDNSFEVFNYGTLTTSAFAAAVLPQTISLRHDTRRRHLECENRTIRYFDGETQRVVDGDGEYVRFYYRADADVWTPDPAEVRPFEYMVTDIKVARALSKAYHLRDFATYCEVTLAHLYEAPLHCGHSHVELCEALLAKDFRRAATRLPLVEHTKAFGNEPTEWAVDTFGAAYVGPKSLRLFRDKLYDEEGALVRTAVKLPTAAEYEKIMRRIKAHEQAGAYL